MTDLAKKLEPEGCPNAELKINHSTMSSNRHRDFISQLQESMCRDSKSTSEKSSFPNNRVSILYKSASTKSNIMFTLLAICVISVLIRTSMSSPIGGFSPRPWWTDACGLYSNDNNPVPMSIPVDAMSDISKYIVKQAKISLKECSRTLDEFRRHLFGRNFTDGEPYSIMHHAWMGSVEIKKFGKRIPDEELEALNFDETLKSLYIMLQKFAVGLEAIYLDQSTFDGPFKKHFRDIQGGLKHLLCEFQIGLNQKDIQVEDVNRDVMPESDRDIDDTSLRNLRDWVIFRDYVNVLQYVKYAFEYFEEKGNK